MRHSDIRLTMNHYTDASQLPVYEAIETLPNLAAYAGSSDTQLNTQTTGLSRKHEPVPVTAPPTPVPSKVLYPEEFWRKQTATDAVGQSDAENCLARTRT